ncbi:hypothetical protein ACHAXT_009791 [Thalassiosira profunda]
MRLEGDQTMTIRKRAHAPSEGGERAVPRDGAFNRSSRKNPRVAPSIGRMLLIGLTSAFLAAIYLGVGGRGHHHSAAISESASSAQQQVAKQPKDWSHCEDSPPAPSNASPAADKKLEPLWLPTYPTSLPAIYEPFLKVLTGIPTAAKNYYRQSKSLRRCHQKNANALIDGISCEIVHPIVPCERPHPSAQRDNFGRAVLLATRNPLTAFPAFHQEKAEKYHGQVGQVSIEDWVKFRDEYLQKTLFTEWKQFINEWRSMKPYHIAAYLRYEDWSDEDRGPALVASVASVLRGEGFPVRYTDESETACLWHTQVHNAIVAEERKLKEGGWYTPEYTKEQLQYLAEELQTFIDEVKGADDGKRPGDEQLVVTLNGYREDVLELI